jgi:sugar O-acyltransferase (sialic acid O-acetyltransferase NeuD family)
MLKQLVIIGAGGHGREILNIIEACNLAGTAEYQVAGFIVESGYGTPGTLINGKPILGDFNWLKDRAAEVSVIGAVGSPALRNRLVYQAQQLGFEFETLIHPGALLTPYISLGKGVVIAAGAILSSQIKLGNHVHINIGCTISHDVVMEDFVTISPGAHIAGNVRLETGCFIGLGASIIEGKRIGQWSLVGAGSVIIRDVPAHTTVAGVPGRLIKTGHSLLTKPADFILKAKE